jgi:platelet-activating factor acetylhydrolase
MSPVLVVGSHDWNTPNAAGELACGGPQQEAILRATSRLAGSDAAHAEGGALAAGGGAILIVVKGTSHHSFNDIPPLFEPRVKWLLKLVRSGPGDSTKQGPPNLVVRES